MEKIISMSVLLLFFAGCGIWETADNQKGGGNLKTVFLHIDGFTKSKSGAI